MWDQTQIIPPRPEGMGSLTPGTLQQHPHPRRVPNHKNKSFHVYQTLPVTVFSCPYSNSMRWLLLFPF